jgi:transglutaminase-like putative cysteine protease
MTIFGPALVAFVVSVTANPRLPQPSQQPTGQAPQPVQLDRSAAVTPGDQVAARVAGTGGTVRDKVDRLVSWMTSEFAWTATDYQQRTPEQIIERRAGNCADLARVLARLLDTVHIRYRMVREINIQPESESREANAERRIATGGPRFSVFGARHNDHTWLEVLDPETGTWFPADPAVGVVGLDRWIRARLALEERTKPPVPAVLPIVEAMLEPFAVVVVGELHENRSAYYLLDAFDSAYAGRLHTLPAWKDWSESVADLAPLAARAFAGEVNLHEHREAIARAADAYDQLRRQAAAASLSLK